MEGSFLNTIQNEAFSIALNADGTVEQLRINGDPFQMNWVINNEYLTQHGFQDSDKLFGQFTLVSEGQTFHSTDRSPVIRQDKDQEVEVQYDFGKITVCLKYDLTKNDQFIWSIKVINNDSHQEVTIESFYVWASIAYIMFRDRNVAKNINESCAVFPHLSNHYSKLACMRRSNQGPHLGLYHTRGSLSSVGSYCRYQNLFLEQVSPSLDGCIFHSLILCNSGVFENKHDWIYKYGNNTSQQIAPQGSLEWEFVFQPFESKEAFYENGYKLGHPIVNYTPVMIKNSSFQCDVKIPKGRNIRRIWFEQFDGDEVKSTVIPDEEVIYKSKDEFKITSRFYKPGEKKLVLEFDNGAIDFVVFNVLEPIRDIIENRIRYLCEHSFIDKEDHPDRFAFQPVSNQGESLGKLCLILTKNLIADKVVEEIRKVEESAVFYVKEKWFIDGDFASPRKLYGGFYRIFDLDYIGHIFYLLSKFNAEDLSYNPPETYLKWATEVMITRFDESLHQDEREKKETRLCGVFSLYIQDLLEDSRGLSTSKRLTELWEKFGIQLKNESKHLAGAITEHYYDNAGFGPSCETLLLFGCKEEAAKYGELLLANIGFSNDYRSQNPDRWWEALAYMVHSLWGGLVAYSTLVAYEHLRQIDYLKAAYRAMMAVFLCYDWNVRSTPKLLKKGEAASTYCVSSPNHNYPELSRNRFGQSFFIKENSDLFGNATGDDWDMGQELVAYLNGFGTKTYLYYENGELKCINGDIEIKDNQYIIRSFAAYPKEYHFYEKGISYVSKTENIVPVIAFDGERFYEVNNEC